MQIFGVEYLEAQHFPDSRGSLTKFFMATPSNSVPFPLSELFVSFSHQGVVRGLHLQTGSAANWRIVSIANGKIFDVLLDLRNESETFGNLSIEELTPSGNCAVVIPPGVAHGFQAIEDSQLVYATSSSYAPAQDTGININDLNIPWPLPIGIQSARDKNLPDRSYWGVI